MVQATEPTADTMTPPTDEALPQTPEAAAPSDEAAAAGDGAASTTPTFDFDSDEGISAALERLPRLRERFEKQQDDGFNAGRQRRDKELRLERGSEDTARAWQENLASKYGIELDEADRRDAPLWVKANRDRERADYWRTTTEQVLEAFDVSERQRIAEALDQFEGLPDQTEQIARQVIDTAVTRQTSRRLADLTLADIPKESKLWTEVEAFKRSEIEKEFAARAQERETPPNPPRTPVGAVGTQRTRETYADMTAQEIADLPPDEYRIAMGYPA